MAFYLTSLEISRSIPLSRRGNSTSDKQFQLCFQNSDGRRIFAEFTQPRNRSSSIVFHGDNTLAEKSADVCCFWTQAFLTYLIYCQRLHKRLFYANQPSQSGREEAWQEPTTYKQTVLSTKPPGCPAAPRQDNNSAGIFLIGHIINYTERPKQTKRPSLRLSTNHIFFLDLFENFSRPLIF